MTRGFLFMRERRIEGLGVGLILKVYFVVFGSFIPPVVGFAVTILLIT